MKKIKVAILGAGFIADIHQESYHRFVPNAEVVDAYARNKEKVMLPFTPKVEKPVDLWLVTSEPKE